jgi:tRNA pseudouridine55 synthase
VQKSPSGILPVDKPGGITSHDVVDRVRGLLGIRRVGHTGTLDPMATGVLVLCLGRATRLSEYLTGQRKTYRARVRFGQETDTFDADGRTLASGGTPPAGLEEIRPALDAFAGDLDQVPPMYSAVKVAGRRLHEMARSGEQVARPPRRVHIHRLEPVAYEAPDLDIEVSCSKGTYIRVLAHDLGRRLGCGAHLTALRRTAAGSIGIGRCRSLAELERIVREDRLDDALMGPSEALSDLPEVRLDPRQSRAFLHGNPAAVQGGFADGTTLRVAGHGGGFLGIGRWQPQSGGLQPVRVIADPHTADAL